MPPTPKEKLYQSLKEKGLYTKSFEDFNTQFSDPEKVNKLHSALTEKGLYTKSVEDFNNQFEFGSQKKSQEQALVNGSQDLSEINPAVANAFDVSRKGKELQQLIKTKNQEINKRLESHRQKRIAEIQPLLKTEQDVKDANAKLDEELMLMSNAEVESIKPELEQKHKEFSEAYNSPFKDPNFAKGFQETYDLSNKNTGQFPLTESFRKKFGSALTDMIPRGISSAIAGSLNGSFDQFLANQQEQSKNHNLFVKPFDVSTDKQKVSKAVDNYIKEVGVDQYEKEKQKFESDKLKTKEDLLAYSALQAGQAEGKTGGLASTTGDIKDVPSFLQYVGGNVGQAAAFSVPTVAAGLVNPALGFGVAIGLNSAVEKGGAYEEGLNLMEQNTGLSKHELLKTNADQALLDSSTRAGIINGMLEYTGQVFTVGKLMPKNFIVESITKLLKNNKAVGVTVGTMMEGFTEWLQAKSTHYAAMYAEAIRSGKTPEEASQEAANFAMQQDDSEEFYAGLTGGLGLGAASHFASINPKIQTKNGTNTPTETEAGATQEGSTANSETENQEVNDPITGTNTTGGVRDNGTVGQAGAPVDPTVQPETSPSSQQADQAGVQPNATSNRRVEQEVAPSVLEKNVNLQDNGKSSENQGHEINPVSRGTKQEDSGIKQEDAENITREIQNASPKTQGFQRSTRQIKQEQDKALESYAKKEGAFIEDVKKYLGEKIAGGLEQDVYANENKTKVIKVNGLTNHSSWDEFWDRQNLQKLLFPNEAYKLIGFTKRGGRLSAVSEQPFIEGDPVPRQELIEDLAKLGFYQIHPEGSLGENQFFNTELGVRLSDVHSENVIKDADGNIRYIDPMLDRENPFVDEESKQHFNEQKAKLQPTQNLEALPEANQNNQPNEEGQRNEGIKGQQELLNSQEAGQDQSPDLTYDSIYFPATDYQEGELVVFDRSKVTFNGQIPNQNQQQSSTPRAAQQNTPENGGEAPPDQGNNQPPSEGVNENNLSGIKKALAPDDLIENTQVDKRTQKQVLDQGKEDVDSGKVNPRYLVTSIIKDARALQPNEVAALVYYKAQLDNEAAKTTKEYLDALDNNSENVSEKKNELDDIHKRLNDYYEMSIITANQQSLAFRLRKMMLDSEFNLQSQINKYKSVNKGQISDEILKRFNELDAKLKDANDRIEELEKNQQKREEEFYFKEIQEAERKARQKLITQEKKKKISNFFDSLKVDTKNNTVNASVIPGITLLPHVWNGSLEVIKQSVLAGYDAASAIQAGIDYIKKQNKDFNDDDKFREGMNPLVQKIIPKPIPERNVTVDEKGISIPNSLIKELVANGTETIEDLTNQIQDLIKDTHPEITIRQIRDAITKYGKQVSLSEDEIDVKIRALKRAGKVLSQLEDLAKKIRPLRSGLQRDKLTDEERRAQKQVRELLKDLPVDLEEEERTWKSALDKVKSRLTNQIADLEAQLATGEKTPKRKGIQYDQEALDLQAKRDELKQILEDLEGQQELSDEQKLRMAIKSTEKSIEDYERRIANKDFSKQKNSPPQSEQLNDLRTRRDALKNEYKQLKDLEGITAKERLESSKKAVAKAIGEYQRRINEKDFIRKKPIQVTPDAELQKLKSERERVKYEYEVEQEKNRLANRTNVEKAADFVLDVTTSLTKSAAASFDLSAPLRQGGYLITYPKEWTGAFMEMLRQAGSEAKYQQWLLDLKASDQFPLIQQTKLFVADNNAKLSASEEQFMSRIIKKIPILGQVFQASNRAYAGFLNKFRVSMFANLVDVLQEQGHTFENNPKAYKEVAEFINNATGRGNLGKIGNVDLDAATPVLNVILFSPKFLASRFRILNPKYYFRLSPPVRIIALKQTAKYVSVYMGYYLIMTALGFEVDDDPTSNDFLKFKKGNLRYEVVPGFGNVIRFMAVMATRSKKNSTGQHYQVSMLNTIGQFLRSKLSPLVGSGVNLATGTDLIGNPVTPKGEALKLITPIFIGDIAQNAKKGDVSELLATSIPSLFGIGVQNYDATGLSDLDITIEQRNALMAAGARITRPKFEQQYSINGVKRRLTLPEYEQYKTLSEKYIKEAINQSINNDVISNERLADLFSSIIKSQRERARQELFQTFDKIQEENPEPFLQNNY